MTLFAFVLVFASVFLHVAWNFISKSTKPSLAFYMLMSGTAALIWLPFFLTSDLRLSSLPLYFFLFYLGSVASEVMYVAGLAYAYRRGDISLVYPLVRAIPVLLVAAVTILFGLGRTPGRLALLGMLIITLGCILMPLKRFRDFKRSNYMNWIIIFILLGAVGTTGYTILDSSAMALIRQTMERNNVSDLLAYLFMVEAGLTVGQMFFVVSIRREREEFRRLFLHSVSPVLAGICSSCAYGLILFAMAYVTNVSYIQAFRQMSLPLGFFAGILILKESHSTPKVFGIVLIVLGLIMVSLG